MGYKLNRINLKIGTEETEIIRKEFFQTNIQRWKLYLWIATPLSLFHIIIFTINLDPGVAVEYSWRKGIILMHIILMIIAVTFGVYAYFFTKKRQTANQFDQIMPSLFCLLLMVSGSIIAAIDQQVTAAITPFLLVCLVSGLFLMIRPVYLIFVSLASFLLFCLLMRSTQINPDIVLSNEVNGLMFVGLSIGLSFILWKVSLKRHQQNRLIIRQKAALEESYQKLSENAGELEKANATKDRFFSIIAHDLLGPIAGLGSYLEVLDEESKNSPGKLSETIGPLRNSVDNTLRLVENLLSWARTQSQDIKFNPKPVDIVAILANSAQALNSQSVNKHITIGMPTQKQPLMVNGDSNMLETIFRNLLSNAIKFSYSGGQIEIVIHQTHELAVIKITDHGVGITQVNLDKLFKLGEKVSSRGTNYENGTGLGLILCQEFIGHHNGRILVESQPGSGSTFTVEIPLIVKGRVVNNHLT